MVAQVKLSAIAVGGVIQTPSSGILTVGVDGTITVNAADVPELLKIGCTYVSSVSRWQAISACRLGTAARVVASAALSNGTYAIANQPDVPRVVGVRVDPGTSALSAGNLALVYIANDGTVQTDNISVVTAASTPFTTNSSKGVMHVNSLTASALAGGASPLVQVNDTNILGLAVDPGFQDFAVIKENVDGADEAVGTVTATAGAVLPTTAPNGTHTFGFAYTYLSPTP